jgi:hypothetical protein
MPTKTPIYRIDHGNEPSVEELSNAKKARLVREVFTQRQAFDGWVLRHPRGFAAALGLCGAPQTYFEEVAERVRRSRAKERGMKKTKAEPFSGVSELSGNLPWDGLIGLLNGVQTARLMNEILVPMMNNTLELQNLTLRSVGSNLVADLKPKLAEAANLARSGLSDLAIKDMAGAKRKLKALEKAVGEIRDALDK